MVYAALYCDLSLKPEKFNWANESSPNTTTSTFIPSISNDSFKGSARLVDKAVEKSALGIIKSPIGLLIIENMKVTPSNRGLPSSFTEKRDSTMSTIVENPPLSTPKMTPTARSRNFK